MSQTFFFYDLETSGLNPREDRIMQFAGQRTDMDLQPIGEPYNVLVALNDDTLPSPHAVMVTGITPQQTITDGYTEAEFARLLQDEIFTPNTIAVGYNNIRFDDEFIRYLFWRTFQDPYAWSWKDGRSRWDLLDVVRMTRALRPEGIEWPEVDGVAVNKLELLSKVNGLVHTKAHDALSDVEALIGVTKLIKQKQPQLYDYLLKMRDKNQIKQLVNLEQKKPFVYSSGRYDAAHNKTTIAVPLTAGKNGNVLVYDTRHDPTPFLKLSRQELERCLFASREQREKEDIARIPVKELQYNRCPAVAPLGVLEQSDGWVKIGLDAPVVAAHQKLLFSDGGFAEKIRDIFENRELPKGASDAEAQLYSGFLDARDVVRVEAVRNADADKLADFHPQFDDERLSSLLLHYKARNYPKSLSDDERQRWEVWRGERLRARLATYGQTLQALAKQSDESKYFLLEELQLWAESIIPVVEPTDE